MTFHQLTLFIVTMFVASILPGPSMLLALSHGMQHGARRTLVSALGNVLVSIIQAAVSLAGLGAILVASQVAFVVIKLLGAAYLVYMGLSILMGPTKDFGSINSDSESNGSRSCTMFWQSVFVTAGNPKAIIFFSAVFPQFIEPGASHLPQFATLIGVGSVIAFTCFMIYAVGGQKLVSLLSSARVKRYLPRVVGTTFVGAGITLALARTDG